MIIHDVYQDDNRFPLWAGYLAAVLEQNDIQVETYCMDVCHYTIPNLEKYLEHNEFSIICVGFLAARFKETILPLCNVINRYKKNAWLVLGGHGASATPEYILEKTAADVVVVGEGENVIVDIANHDKSGIVFASPLKNLDSIPFPAWHLFPIHMYANCVMYSSMRPSDKSLMIITSRGCVNSCSFCYRLEKGLRMRSIPSIVEEIKTLNEVYDISYFEFGDECFLLNSKRIERFFCELQDTGLDIKFYCAARVNDVTTGKLELLKDCGCRFINYGFESTNQEVLDLMDKNVSVEDNVNAAQLTKEAGILFGVNMLWGCPGDTVQTLYDDMEFIKRYNTYGQLRTIRPVTPYPGCSLYYKALEDGLLSDVDDFYSRFKNSDLVTVNFTSLSLDVMYKNLFKVNQSLILDHYQHTGGDDPGSVISGFHDLYFDGVYSFRGARHYGK